MLDAWESELGRLADEVDRERREYLTILRPVFERVGAALLGEPTGLRYQRGWGAEQDLVSALREQREGDRSMGFTRAGPQRADLQFELADERSRWRASKGQQKLLASAFVLAQSELVAEALQRPVALVVDEPAADLDATHLNALMSAIQKAPAQIFLAAISADGLPLAPGARVFHVEHGIPKALL